MRRILVWALTKTLDCGTGRRCWSRGGTERCVFEKAVKTEVRVPKSTCWLKRGSEKVRVAVPRVSRIITFSASRFVYF